MAEEAEEFRTERTVTDSSSPTPRMGGSGRARLAEQPPPPPSRRRPVRQLLPPQEELEALKPSFPVAALAGGLPRPRCVTIFL